MEPTSTTRDLLTAAPWKVEKALMLGVAQSDTTDITYQFTLVALTFFSDGKYNATVQIGTWELVENDTRILFDKNSALSFTADILSLTAATLQLKLFYPNEQQIVPLLVTLTAAPEIATSKSPEKNFETLWKEFDTRYSFFEIKHTNWDSLRSVYRTQITGMTTEQNLFQILSSMIGHLKDGHVNLYTPYGTYAYNGWYSKYPTNFLGLSITARYLTTDYGTTAAGAIRFGKIQNDIGYLYIGPNFAGDQAMWSQAIDAVVDSLKNMRGMIVDIRSNGGGSDYLGMIVAGRFADRTRTYSYVQYRNGPRHTDFTPMDPRTISPQGPRQFLKPVALLTNRRCFSSAEGTTLMFRALENVTVIGDTTGGGSGNPISLQLPNGWNYRLSRWIQYAADQKVFEGIGLAPDIPQWISFADSVAGRDAILERAIQHLSVQQRML
ncbi:MAG TPA: S41 family peptidase [Bacteroidota bacterium]